MYKLLFFCLIVAVVLMSACESKKSEQTETFTTKQSEQAATTAEFPKFDNDYLVSIYEAQELIKIDHSSLELRKKFCEKAYHADKGLLVTMGIAKRVHPDNGQAIPVQMAERAAKLDAMRWAGYCIHWLESNYEPSFGEIQTTINQQTTVLDHANVGDSLFIFIATEYQKK